MRHLRSLFLGVAAPVAASLLITAAGCNSGSTGGSAAPTTAIIGAGSTFIYPAMSRWIEDYQKPHPGVQINYQSIGSGGGIRQLQQGVVDFGASDVALTDDQLKTMPAVIQLPESAGPVCITYNLPDLKEPLKLSGSTLADIFLGKIKTWRDPAIRKDNPGVTLPKDPVVVAHRSDGSGTTGIFTTYLDKISPEWSKKVGKGISVEWPVGLGGKGSEGVTGIVKQSPGTIGYVELSYAQQNNLPVAEIRNLGGEYLKPSAEGTTAAIDAYSAELAKDVRTPIVEPPATAKDAYPIAGLTFLIVPKDSKDAPKAQAVKSFIEYVITDGQATAATLNYAKLPPSIQQQDQQLLNQMTANGQSLK
jgi:phosphate transport system substrate-binding protein